MLVALDFTSSCQQESDFSQCQSVPLQYLLYSVNYSETGYSGYILPGRLLLQSKGYTFKGTFRFNNIFKIFLSILRVSEMNLLYSLTS